MIYVLTVYAKDEHARSPDVSMFEDDMDADRFIKACLKWGIGIVSCEKVSEADAKEMLIEGKAETFDDILEKIEA